MIRTFWKKMGNLTIKIMTNRRLSTKNNYNNNYVGIFPRVHTLLKKNKNNYELISIIRMM